MSRWLPYKLDLVICLLKATLYFPCMPLHAGRRTAIGPRLALQAQRIPAGGVLLRALRPHAAAWLPRSTCRSGRRPYRLALRPPPARQLASPLYHPRRLR